MGSQDKVTDDRGLSFNDTQHATSIYDVTRVKPFRHLVADITIQENII